MSRGGGQKQSEEYESKRVSVDETVRYVERERESDEESERGRERRIR